MHFIDEIRPRKLLVLDESPTIDYFFPRSVELFTYSLTKRRLNVENNLESYMKHLKRVKEIIEKKKEAKEKGERAKDIDKYDKAILEIIEQLEKLNEFLDAKEWRKVNKDGITELLPDPERYKGEEEKILKRLSSYVFPDECDPLALFEAILYPYEERWVYWQSSGNNQKHTVWLVGDAEEPRFHLDSIQLHPRIIIVGGIMAEYFATKIAADYPETCCVIESDEFPYAKNYLVIPVDAVKDSEEGRKGRKERREERMRRRNLLKVLCGLREHGLPSLIFTGSKEKQLKISNSFPKKAYRVRDETVEEIAEEYYANNILVAYTNSRISRGLDIPFIDVVAIMDADFAIPYWQARAEVAAEKRIKDTVIPGVNLTSEDIVKEIIAEEATNAALRTAPTHYFGTVRRKIILIPRDELEKLRHLAKGMEDRTGKIEVLEVPVRSKKYLNKIIEIVREAVAWRTKDLEEKLLNAFLKESVKKCREEKKPAESFFVSILYWEIPTERASFWEQMVKEGRLKEACNTFLSDKEIEVDDKTFDVVSKLVVNILKEKKNQSKPEKANKPR